ncbi:hypothetical protein BDC45DRAFT_499728 [Circinella umbellata]|nr:hypothetical protein BDC45DRAFT_499728 [Circinella umbellata]
MVLFIVLISHKHVKKKLLCIISYRHETVHLLLSKYVKVDQENLSSIDYNNRFEWLNKDNFLDQRVL